MLDSDTKKFHTFLSIIIFIVTKVFMTQSFKISLIIHFGTLLMHWI